MIGVKARQAITISMPETGTSAAAAAAQRLQTLLAKKAAANTQQSGEAIEQHRDAETRLHATTLDGDYPVPLSPRMGEAARGIELERAMAAEAAMKGGAAVSREAILFEDEWMIIVNKPCGLYSEHVLASIPCLLTDSQTYIPPFSDSHHSLQCGRSELPHLHMANRLDRDTSGVMVITKCKTAAKKLMHAFTAREVKKTYIALCIGIQPAWSKMTVESGHGRSKNGAWRVYAKVDVGRMLPGGSKVKEIITHLSIVKRLPTKNEGQGFHEDEEEYVRECAEKQVTIAGEGKGSFGVQCNSSGKQLIPNEEGKEELVQVGADIRASEFIVKASPLTGKTHQIRLHCQYLGLSLRGDVKYGGPYAWNGTRYERHTLHAKSLSFKHPITSTDLHILAPLPEWAL